MRASSIVVIFRDVDRLLAGEPFGVRVSEIAGTLRVRGGDKAKHAERLSILWSFGDPHRFVRCGGKEFGQSEGKLNPPLRLLPQPLSIHEILLRVCFRLIWIAPF